MSDERASVFAFVSEMSSGGWAVLASTIGTIAVSLAGLAQWLIGRRDRSEEREQKERAEFEAARDKMYDQLRTDVKTYRDRWQEADARSVVWERRCRIIDDHAHRLRHQINNERMIASGRLELAGLAPIQWPDNPPLPKLEDL